MTQPPALNVDQRDALAALAHYHLLTVDQLQRVGVADGSKRRVEAALRLLRRKHLVGHRPAETIGLGDRLPALHWPLPRGAAQLASGKGSERSSVSVTHARHRLAIVDVHIALQEWAYEAGAGVRFLADFEPNGRGELRPTTLLYAGHKFTPDGLIRVELADGDVWTLALEVERGGRKQDRNPFRDGLRHWRGVAEDGVMEQVLGLQRPALFLIVFQSADMRRKALADWPGPTAPIWRRFLCKGVDELGPDFNSGWYRPGGGQHTLFPAALPLPE